MTSVTAQYVVMGVAGCGKTTLGRDLAARLNRRFVDGDSLHSEGNVAKMSAGEPLTDSDRWPWLASVREALTDGEPVVVACSALRRAYRDYLRQAPAVVFIFLELDPATAIVRTTARTAHFMSAEMVASQFDALERPDVDEHDVVIIDATRDPAAVLDSVSVAIAAM